MLLLTDSIKKESSSILSIYIIENWNTKSIILDFLIKDTVVGYIRLYKSILCRFIMYSKCIPIYSMDY